MGSTVVRRPVLVVVLFGLLGGVVGLPIGPACAVAQDDSDFPNPSADGVGIAECLDTILERIPSIPPETRLRRDLAQATFCLPQNALGILYYAFLQAAGRVLHTQEMNETTIVVTGEAVGASLGRYLFVPAAFLTEDAVRHEYGHTMQGYRHGPFYLLFEGTASFLQAAISRMSPSFARGYFDRWPENEASELGGV